MKKIRKCRLCGTQKDLTIHHVYGGVLCHRKKNVYTKIWKAMGLKKVILCQECHDEIHYIKKKKQEKIPKKWVDYQKYIKNKINRYK